MSSVVCITIAVLTEITWIIIQTTSLDSVLHSQLGVSKIDLFLHIPNRLLVSYYNLRPVLSLFEPEHYKDVVSSTGLQTLLADTNNLVPWVQTYARTYVFPYVHVWRICRRDVRGSLWITVIWEVPNAPPKSGTEERVNTGYTFKSFQLHDVLL